MTNRKKIFIEAYVNDARRNQTAAAIAAGYSPNTAAQAASRLMKEPEVKEEILNRLAQIHAEKTAEADEVVEFLTSVMRGERVDRVILAAGGGFQGVEPAEPSAADKIKAAELLGKYYAIFTDKASIETDGAIQIINDIRETGENEKD